MSSPQTAGLLRSSMPTWTSTCRPCTQLASSGATLSPPLPPLPLPASLPGRSHLTRCGPPLSLPLTRTQLAYYIPSWSCPVLHSSQGTQHLTRCGLPLLLMANLISIFVSLICSCPFSHVSKETPSHHVLP